MFNMYMKKVLLLITLALCAIVSRAETADTLVINRYKTIAPQALVVPYMSDSVGYNGKAYDSMEQLKFVPSYRMDDPQLVSVVTDSEGYVKLPTDGDHRDMLHTYIASILSSKFVKATLIVESNIPLKVFLEGKEICSLNDGKQEQEITIQPAYNHHLIVRVLAKGDSEPQWRLRVVPAIENAPISLTDNDTERLSVQYMLTGKSVVGTAVSPTGKYSLLTIAEKVNNKSVYSLVLYEGTKVKAYLDGSYLRASWMPRTDKLWYTENSDTGKRLMALDVATMRREIIHPSIPKEGSFLISPNEQQLIYFVEVKGPKKNDKVERVMGRYDCMNGYRDRTFLALFDLRSGAFQPLTYGYRDTSLQDISSDGKEIIFSTFRPTTRIPFSENDFFIMNLETLKVDTLFTRETDISQVYYTSDPHYLLIDGTPNAFNGIGKNLPEGIEANTYDAQLFLYNRGSKETKALTKDFNPNVTDVQVLRDKFEVLFTAENKDYVSLYRCQLSSGKITQIPTTEEVVRRFSVDDRGMLITYAGQSVNNSDKYYHITNRGEQLVYDLAGEKMKDLDLGTVHDWSFSMPNGDVVPGRYYLPPHFDATKSYPMIVYYYGGTSPTARNFEGAYSLPMFAAQDYIVLTLNPSGTTGWGQEYAARHLNAWGKRTADEIVASVKGFTEQHPYVDASHVGCIGASYGGFMTQYLQTITDIFAAAVSHAGISALSSYWGEGTWGVGYSTVASFGSYPWNNPELYTKQSPLFNADKINTPLLLLHGTADVNVPIGESVQMYNALKILGKEVEFVKVYGEDHGVVDPEKRLLWMQTTMAWFQKWLKGDSSWWDTLYPTTNL